MKERHGQEVAALKQDNPLRQRCKPNPSPRQVDNIKPWIGHSRAGHGKKGGRRPRMRTIGVVSSSWSSHHLYFTPASTVLPFPYWQ